MKLPIKFPKDEDVIIEEVTRFRALSAKERMHWIRDLLYTGGFLMNASGREEFVRELMEQEEQGEQRLVKEFLARHGG